MIHHSIGDGSQYNTRSKKMVKIFIIVVLFSLWFLFVSCPTPFGILYGDKIIHWDGETETIKDWLDGEEQEEEQEMTHVTIITGWGDE